jgi:hypothetical protein
MVDIIQEAEKQHLGGKKQSSKKKDQAGDWKAGEDVDKLCSIFTNFLTSPANFAKFQSDHSSSVP